MGFNLSVVILFVSLSGACFAKGAGPIERGGLGFLFSDSNNFVNPGLFASSRAFALDAKYDTASNGITKGVSTSAVFGSGAVGIGAFGSRSGSNLSTSGSYADTAGVGLGLGVAKGRVLIGAGYRRGVSTGQTDDGRVDATMTFKNADKGVSFGLGATTQINSVNDELKTATVAVGYGFSKGFTVEANAVANNLANTGDLSGAAYLTRNGQNGFLSLGYLWHNLLSQHGASARVGCLLGRSVDVSVYTTHTFVSGANPSYGGSLRLVL